MQVQKLQSRKKFLVWSAAAFSSVTVLRFFGRSKKKKSETVKMLSQDGHLVEIDKSHMASASKKISDFELQHWINTKQ